jgi:hypothetical protein
MQDGACKSPLHRVVTAFTDDQETLDLYHGHARAGRGPGPGSTRKLRSVAWV